jgi:hypothetical protein
MYLCQLVRVRPGGFGGVSEKLMGRPAVFDVNLGDGGESSLRDVMLTLIRQSVGNTADTSEFRVRVSEVGSGKRISDFGVTGGESSAL